MGETTGIEWSDSTFNPWVGCSNVSPGCARCYARTLVENRMGKDFSTLWRTAKVNWAKVRRWDREVRPGERHTVFCASLSDIFHPDADVWREDLWALIRETPNLTFQILTKRPERIRESLPQDWGEYGYKNVWLGTSVELQRYAEPRITALLKVPAPVHFLSCEPLLGPLNLYPYLGTRDETAAQACLEAGLTETVRWVIAGGESGHGAREMAPSWVQEIRNQCVEYSVPFFFKQWGGPSNKGDHDQAVLDGRTWKEMPSHQTPQSRPGIRRR